MADNTEKTEEQLNPVSAASTPTPEEIASLREQLEVKEREASENLNRYLRERAELENFKKRTQREREDAIRYANEGLIRDLVPIIDNLERAVAHAKTGVDGSPLIEGVDMVLKGLVDVFTRHGVVQVTAVGEVFDPTKHEAMAQVESDQHKANTVVEEFNKGYLYRDRLLRPALVSVATSSRDKEIKDGERSG
jgi:molecular chaperone GrpE